MGILLDVDRAEAISNAVRDVEARTGSSRPTREVIIQVYNRIDRAIQVFGGYHESGWYGVPPSQEIPAGMVDVFSSRRHSWRMEGAIGQVRYRIDTQSGSVFAHAAWRNPYMIGRKNKASAWLGPTNDTDAEFRDRLEIFGRIGSGSTAHARYELRFKNGGNQGGNRGGGAGGGIGGGKNDGPIHQQ